MNIEATVVLCEEGTAETVEKNKLGACSAVIEKFGSDGYKSVMNKLKVPIFSEKLERHRTWMEATRELCKYADWLIIWNGVEDCKIVKASELDFDDDDPVGKWLKENRGKFLGKKLGIV